VQSRHWKCGAPLGTNLSPWPGIFPKINTTSRCRTIGAPLQKISCTSPHGLRPDTQHVRIKRQARFRSEQTQPVARRLQDGFRRRAADPASGRGTSAPDSTARRLEPGQDNETSVDTLVHNSCNWMFDRAQRRALRTAVVHYRANHRSRPLRGGRAFETARLRVARLTVSACVHTKRACVICLRGTRCRDQARARGPHSREGKWCC
jgi:hypothetical protein